MILSVLSSPALVSGLMVARAKNPVHSVLFPIPVFRDTSGLLLLLGLDFFAMIFPVVHIGAIAVLFLSGLLLFPFASNSSTYPNKLSAYELIEDAHLHLVLLYLKSEPILKMGLLLKIGLLIIYISWWLRIGGIEDAVVPFLSANGNPNPDPGLPPSSSGEPLGLVIADNQRQQHDTTSINFLEAPSVAEEDIWDAIDLTERPLFSDEERKQILAEKMFRSHHRTDTPKGSALLEKHFLFEQILERHLRRCGYTSKDIMRVLPELRSKLLYSKGRSRKIHELTKWIHDMELDFKRSDPYKIIKGLYIIFTSKELGK